MFNSSNNGENKDIFDFQNFSANNNGNRFDFSNSFGANDDENKNTFNFSNFNVNSDENKLGSFDINLFNGSDENKTFDDSQLKDLFNKWKSPDYKPDYSLQDSVNKLNYEAFMENVKKEKSAYRMFYYNLINFNDILFRYVSENNEKIDIFILDAILEHIDKIDIKSLYYIVKSFARYPVESAKDDISIIEHIFEKFPKITIDLDEEFPSELDKQKNILDFLIIYYIRNVPELFLNNKIKYSDRRIMRIIEYLIYRGINTKNINYKKFLSSDNLFSEQNIRDFPDSDSDPGFDKLVKELYLRQQAIKYFIEQNVKTKEIMNNEVAKRIDGVRDIDMLIASYI